MTNQTFILASSSPRRLALLASVGITPSEIIAANIDESPKKGEAPHLYSRRIASEKAAAIAAQYPNAVILAADTVVVCGARILPKAEDIYTARKCLALLSGKRHRVYTSVVVRRGEKICDKTVMTVVQFDRLMSADIDAYIASNEWQQKAGGYAIQGLAQRFIPRINGSYSSVVGLPLKETCGMLEIFEVRRPTNHGLALCESQQARSGSKKI